MKALIVDDCKITRAIIRKILEKRGFKLFEAEDGQKALKSLEKHQFFDVILLDWNMPVMDGYAFLKMVRKNPDWNDIKVMIVTTENDQQKVMEALNAGADEYLMKPFNETMLLDKLDLLIKGSFT